MPFGRGTDVIFNHDKEPRRVILRSAETKNLSFAIFPERFFGTQMPHPVGMTRKLTFGATCLRIVARVLAQAPEIIRHRVLISRRNRLRIAAADLAGIVIVLLPAQPQFQFIHAR